MSLNNLDFETKTEISAPSSFDLECHPEVTKFFGMCLGRKFCENIYYFIKINRIHSIDCVIPKLMIALKPSKTWI